MNKQAEYTGICAAANGAKAQTWIFSLFYTGFLLFMPYLGIEIHSPEMAAQMFDEFKKFALRGNMLDLAIGVIIGTAFSNLVNSIVKDLFMPILGLLTGGMDFSNIFWQMSGPKQPTLEAAQAAGATLAYGHFVTIAINFIIISFVLFLMVKGLNKLQAMPEKEKKETTEQLLADIRAILERDLDGKLPETAAKAIAKSTAIKTGSAKAKK